MEKFIYLIESANSLLFDKIGVFLILFGGTVLSFRTDFFQIKHLKHWVKNTAGSLFSAREKRSGDAAFSQFGALCTVLAASVGVGNIAGVASAVALGGTGAVFWMWVATLFSSALAFAENLLGVYYRRENEKGGCSGGAMYYLADGLKSRALSYLFSLFCVLASFGMGNLVQVNTVAVNLSATLPLRVLSDVKLGTTDLYMLSVGALTAALVGVVLLGGARRISAVTERLIPFMVTLYSLGALLIVFINIKVLPKALWAILSHAFNGKSAAGGVLGFSFSKAVSAGLRRGVFSNEAGLGAAVSVNASADTDEPVTQGMWGIFQVFVDTSLVCSLTAFALLCSGLVDLESGTVSSAVSPSALISEAFSRFFGAAGGVFVTIGITVFAFSTVIGWSFYGRCAWEYLFGGFERVYLVIYVIFALLGALMDVGAVFALCDLFNALMLLPNASALIILSPTVARVTENYKKRKIEGKALPPLLSYKQNGA